MNEGLDEAALRLIEQRVAATPPGPWESFIEGRNLESGDSFVLLRDESGEQIDVYLSILGSEPPPESHRRWILPLQDFIASARSDVPALITEIRRLRSNEDELQHEEAATEDRAAAKAADRNESLKQRIESLQNLLLWDPTRGKELLLGLANDESEAEDLLDAVGGYLLDLVQVGLVGDFDLRDVSERVADHLGEPEG